MGVQEPSSTPFHATTYAARERVAIDERDADERHGIVDGRRPIVQVHKAQCSNTGACRRERLIYERNLQLVITPTQREELVAQTVQ